MLARQAAAAVLALPRYSDAGPPPAQIRVAGLDARLPIVPIGAADQLAGLQ
jgi:hypothetical protein